MLPRQTLTAVSANARKDGHDNLCRTLQVFNLVSNKCNAIDKFLVIGEVVSGVRQISATILAGQVESHRPSSPYKWNNTKSRACELRVLTRINSALTTFRKLTRFSCLVQNP